MSKFMRALQKAGLVDLVEEPSAEIALEPAPVELEAAAELQAEPAPVAPIGELIEQRPFEQIYAEQALPPSAFSAEKLLKIFDGLAALDPISRKTAVTALDAADDAWSVDDALLDAERKVRALGLARVQIEGHARAALDLAKREVDEREARQLDAVTRVRAQIADLTALLEREVTRATEEKAALHAGARATKESCLREVARLDQEALRLKTIAQIFGPVAPNAAASR